jgi:AcrR family transcriptional regulator
LPRPSSRPYHSPRRDQSARETRLAVLAAARQQFIEHGYAGTSLAKIADAAGVSLATVKLVAGTKAQLLEAAVRSVIRREDPTVPHVEQAWWRDILSRPTAQDVISDFAAQVRAALTEQAPLFEVVYAAASSEPELAQLEQRASLGRWNDVRQVAARLTELRALRGDYDIDAATDVIWALASPQMFRMLVGRRGWSALRWEQWLCDSLSRQLLG